MLDKPVKHSHIMRIIRSRIIRGVYEGKLPSERALAVEFSTSPKTVSVALVELETQGLVDRTERRGTFVVSGARRPGEAPSLYGRLVLENPLAYGRADPWAAVIVSAFQRAARERRVGTMLSYADSSEEAVEEAVLESRGRGSIGTCLVGWELQMKHALRLTDAFGSLVLGECFIEEPIIRSISFDHLDAGRQAAEHLVKLGHRRISFVRLLDAPSFSRSGNDRLRGAEDFLRPSGMPLSVVTGTVRDAYAVMERLLKSPDRPTAIISGGGLATEFLMARASDWGLHVPRDLSVISFSEAHTFRQPEVTSVSWDHEVLGARLIEILVESSGEKTEGLSLLPIRLVDHRTTLSPSAP